MSAFRPSNPSSYEIVDNYARNCAGTNTNSYNISDTESVISSRDVLRQWSDSQTMVVMLLYRRWQLKDRKNIPLNIFQQNCSKELFDLIGISKNPTQVRDKINNTRSSYHTIMKKETLGSLNWNNKKIASMTKPVYTFMQKFFGNDSIITVDEINSTIDQLCKLRN